MKETMGQLEKGIRNCTKSIEHSTRSSTQSPTGSSSIAGLKTPLTTFLTMKRTMTLYWTSKGTHWTRAPNRLRISEFTQNFWVFSFYIADFWQTFWVIWENGSSWSNLRLKMSVSALGRLKNHKIFTQKYRRWLRFYKEFLRKKLAGRGSACRSSCVCTNASISFLF